MYRCQICQAVSKPGAVKQVHRLYREVKGPYVGGPPRQEIAAEVAVCESCQGLLQDGVAYEVVVAQRGKIRTVGTVAPTPKPPSTPPPNFNKPVALKPGMRILGSPITPQHKEQSNGGK